MIVSITLTNTGVTCKKSIESLTKALLRVLCVCMALLLKPLELFPQRKLEIIASTGTTNFNLKWAIAGNMEGQNPNVLSELIWNDLKGYNYNFKVVYRISNRFTISSQLNNTRIKSGKVTDIDYATDDREEVSSNSIFNSNKGYLRNLNSNMAYKIHSNHIELAVFLGIDYKQQNLTLLQGNREFENLDSYYKNNWFGPQTGFIAGYKLNQKLNTTLTFMLERHFYNATANWNLRNDFKHPESFRHKTVVYGFSPSIVFEYLIKDNLGLFCNLNSYYTTSRHGSDILYYRNNDVSRTRLNFVESTIHSINVGLTLQIKSKTSRKDKEII